MTVILYWVTSCVLRKKYQNSLRNMITLPAFPRFCFYRSEVFSRVNTVTNLGKWLQNQKESNLGLSTVERLIMHGLAQ